ncbi:hypothetical protein KM043_000562 [Ampulex compressa]|nr:hypothetical protein KM043_000562 [Ampulex compressa]
MDIHLGGATIISPKFHVRLELPSQILDSQKHFECKHSPRKPLISLMRSMLQCTELQEELMLPLSPTNTFVLLQKTDSNSVSEFFLPKPQYTPASPTSTCFRIKLQHNSQVIPQCNCVEIVKVYDEVSDTAIAERKEVQTAESNALDQASYIWYQSKEVIKGFKYARSNLF